VALTASPGDLLYFTSISGTLSFQIGDGPSTAEGKALPPNSNTDVRSTGPISGLVVPGRGGFLVGVFLPQGSLTRAPNRLVFNDLNFVSLAPLLGQTFFIGNGRTQDGTLQAFLVPQNATRLYLGFVDYCDPFPNLSPPGCYDDNTGGLLARFSATARPELKIERQEGKLTISWEKTLFRFILERSSSVGVNAHWQPVTTEQAQVGSKVTVVQEMSLETSFYRLRL
jgi:hypothetical protein